MDCPLHPHFPTLLSRSNRHQWQQKLLFGTEVAIVRRINFRTSSDDNDFRVLIVAFGGKSSFGEYEGKEGKEKGKRKAAR